jgi:hypothetical protein
VVATNRASMPKQSKAPPYAENEGHYDDGEIVDVTGWLTANQATDLLGCSQMSLSRYTRQGHVRPAKARKDPHSIREVLVYNPSELARLPRKYRGRIPDEAGELTARCFELFDAGHTDRQVVIEMRQTFAKITELREQWLDGGGAQLVVSPAAREEIAGALGEPIESIADLVTKLRARLAPQNDER